MILFWKGVQIIFWDSRKVKVLKMNEMHFVFSHSEKVKYKGKPCPNFLLKGGLDDTFLKGDLKGSPDNILGFKKGKNSQWMKCFLFSAILKKWNIMGTRVHFFFKGGLNETFLKGGPDNILGFKKGKNAQNEWNAFSFQPLWKMK